jgi:hypothetical protein
MRGNTTKGQHFGSQLYLTMKVICTSQQENVAQSQSTRHHSWQRENLPPPCGWKNSCRQSFCRQNRCERSHLFLRAPQSTRISQAPNYRSYLGSRARTERRRRNQHHKGANYGWPLWPTVSIMMARPLATKPKARNEDPSTIGFLLSLLRNDLCNKWYLPQLEGHLVGSLKFQYLELVKLDGAKVIGRQKIATDIGRYVMWRKGRTVSFIWGRRKNSKNYTQLKHLEKSPVIVAQ